MLNEVDINKINEILLEKVNPYLVYIFGSSASGVLREDSDIDIAFLSDEEPSEYDVFMIAQDLADFLRREVDLVNLKKSSTVFKAQVVGTGKVVYCCDEVRRQYFEMYSLKDYVKLNEEREIVLKSIKTRGSIYG